MVHLSDLDWTKPGDEVIKDYKKGDNVKAVVLDVDSPKERISLGIKQLGGDPIDTLAKYKKGDTVTCNVVAVQENGIEVKTADGELTAFIKRSDLSRDRSEQRPERFNVGDKVDAFVTSADKAARRLSSVDQGARDRRGEAGRGAVRLVRLGRFAGRHLQGRHPQAREPTAPRTRRRTRRK